jgi:hypothetical protein
MIMIRRRKKTVVKLKKEDCCKVQRPFLNKATTTIKCGTNKAGQLRCKKNNGKNAEA